MQHEQIDTASRPQPGRVDNVTAGSAYSPGGQPGPVPINAYMPFEQAFNRARNGWAISRVGWNGKGMWVRVQYPDKNSKMTSPYLYIEYPVGHPSYPDGSRVPWIPSETDLFAQDWQQLAFQ